MLARKDLTASDSHKKMMMLALQRRTLLFKHLFTRHLLIHDLIKKTQNSFTPKLAEMLAREDQ